MESLGGHLLTTQTEFWLHCSHLPLVDKHEPLIDHLILGYVDISRIAIPSHDNMYQFFLSKMGILKARDIGISKNMGA